MLFQRSDLPLARDESGRHMPLIIALMVYLAALALAGALSVNSAVSRWNRDLTGTLTVQVPPAEDSSAAGRALEAERLDTVVRLLRATPGVARVAPLDRSQAAALIEPWLGAEALEDLPLPRLIDVTLAPGREVDLAFLAKRLEAAVPGTTVDDHRKWVKDLLDLARTVEVVVAAILLLIGGATGLVIVFATRSSLAIHSKVIEVLHLIGAQDKYIARQFQHHAMSLALRGGLLGLALAVATLVGLRYAAYSGEALLPRLALEPWQWAVLAGIPAATALLASLTARLTVLRTLSRML